MPEPSHASRPQMIVTRRLPAPVEARMQERFAVTFNSDDAPFGRDGLIRAVQRAEILVPTVTDRIDAEVLAHAGARLKLIANFGAGLDHIDLAAAAARGIAVTNTPGVLTEDTADLAMALILAVPRRLVEGARIVESGAWTGWAPTNLLGRRISGKRLGIVGMGRIGRALARRARAFDMTIAYHNRRRLPESVEAPLAAEYWSDLDAMLAAVDIVSLHCPLTPETHHLIARERLARLGEAGYLVNVARGEIVEEDALIEALEAGRIAGAGLDVYEDEPEVPERLYRLATTVTVPHLGSATEEARTGMGEKVIANVERFLEGAQPPDLVVPNG